MLGKDDINQETKALLQLADEEVLTRTIWGLSMEQKRSQVYKEIGQQRYLSALRAGAIDNAEMTKTAFKLDQFFTTSKLAREAAEHGLKLKLDGGKFDVAEKICRVMGIPNPHQEGSAPALPNDTSSV